MRDLINNNMLQAFARNGLQILQWCMLVLLYEAEKRGEELTQDEIRDQLDLPTSNHPLPGGASKMLWFGRYFDLLGKNTVMLNTLITGLGNSQTKAGGSLRSGRLRKNPKDNRH